MTCQKWFLLKSFALVNVLFLRAAQGFYQNKFVTNLQKSAMNWSAPDEWQEEKMTTAASKYRQRSREPSYLFYENSYKLRFHPIQTMPRLFWHKFPQKQEEPPATTVSTIDEMPVTTKPMEPEGTESSETDAPEPEPGPEPDPDPAPVPNPEPEPEPETEMPTVPPPDMMMTTTANPSFMPSTVMPLRPSTTFSTIMKPSSYFPFNIVDKLKNLLIFAPSKVNLIQKHGNIPKVKTKSKGFLSLFEVIQFDNIKCTVNMGDIRSMDGICYHEFECTSHGGIPTERCADGVGVCCIFLTGCGDTTEQSIAYFESPNYPHPFHDIMVCVLVVNLRKNVQQVRVDFLMFELNRPTDGDCEDDQFVVSGQNLNFVVPVLCGINTGHHIYVNVGNSAERKIYLSFFIRVPTGARSFNLKITQSNGLMHIILDTPNTPIEHFENQWLLLNLQMEDNLAPDGCLQFYTDLEGVVKSFNYDTEGTVVENKIATYMNNMNYVICLERAKDKCSITYVMEQIGGSSDQLDFQIVNKNEDEMDLVPDGQAGAGIFNCPDDFVAINQVRLCGERFNDGTENEDFTMNAPVRDVAAGPIILPFRSDSEYVGRGFRLAYRQESCIPNLAPPKPLH